MLIPVEEDRPIYSHFLSEDDFYWVVDTPAPLAGMALPEPSWPWGEIYEAGFSDLVSLAPDDYDPEPLTKVFDQKLQDLSGGKLPRDPEKEENLVREAVCATLKSLRSGRGVVVHCVGGRGRTGTVLGCVLRELRYEAEEIIDYLDRLHKRRDKPGWPESPWQGDLVRRWPI